MAIEDNISNDDVTALTEVECFEAWCEQNMLKQCYKD